MRSIKLILIICLIISPTLLIAQSNQKLILKHKNFPSKLYSVKNQHQHINSYQYLNKTPKQKNTSQKSNAIIIGNTTYDLQTTGSMPRRVNFFSNTKVSTVWLGSSQISTYSDLGTRYNFFDGSQWQWGNIPTSRIETRKTFNGGLNKTRNGEINIAAPNAITKKSNTNTSWDTTRTEVKFENLNWPRTATVGDTIYTIFGSNSPDSISGFKAPIYFSRSFDGGITFSTPTALFAQAAGYDSSTAVGDIGPDHYAIDAYGSTVAILLIGVTEDVIVLKSTNCGNTWTKTIVQEFPIHKYNGGITDANGDGLCDTVLGVTGDGSILIGDNNVVHVVYSDLLLRKCDSGDITIYPINKSDYFKYWNDVEKILVEVPTLLDLNANGIFDVGSNAIGNDNIRYGNSGYSLNPMLASSHLFNYQEFILIVYSAVMESDTDDNGLNYHSIYSTALHNNYIYGPIDISETNSQENVFPTITPRTFKNTEFPETYIQWQQDFDPGVAVNGAHNTTTNDIVFTRWELRFGGIGKSSNLQTKIYPNPANTSINIEIKASYSTLSSVKIINVLGQVLIEKSIPLQAGINKEKLDTSALIPGIYTLLLNADNNFSSEKIIIK